MREAGGMCRLAPEPFDELLVARVALVQDLDRHAAPEIGVLRQPDVRHAARAELALEPVAAGEECALGLVGR